MDLLIQLASPILTAAMAVGGAYIAFNNRLTILETKDADNSQEVHRGDDDQLAELKTEIAVIKAELRSLTDEMRKHNNLMERTFKLEARVESIENRL